MHCSHALNSFCHTSQRPQTRSCNLIESRRRLHTHTHKHTRWMNHQPTHFPIATLGRLQWIQLIFSLPTWLIWLLQHNQKQPNLRGSLWRSWLVITKWTKPLKTHCGLGHFSLGLFGGNKDDDQMRGHWHLLFVLVQWHRISRPMSRKHWACN